VLAAHVPALFWHTSANPIFFFSGLTNGARRGVTPGLPLLDPNAAYEIQALGGFSADQWLHGRIPWWNPYLGVGAPLAGAMQPASFFLPFVLLLHFANGILLLKIALQMVAGVAAFALLRQLALGRVAAVSGAAIYALNGTFAWFADAPIMPIAFLPLLLLGIERAFDSAERKRRGGWIWIAIALAYSLFAGFPETAYLDGLLALAWGLYRFAAAPRDVRWAFARKFATGGAVGLAIAAPLLISFAEYQNLSAIRHNGWGGFGLPKISFAGFLMPYLFGPVHGFERVDHSGQLVQNWGFIGGYISLTVVFLSTTALLSGRRLRGLRILLAIWTAAFIARAINITWVDDVFKFVPGFDFTQVFRYSEQTWSICGAILAAFAIEDWRHGMKRRAAITGAAVSFILGAVALGISSDLIAQLFHEAARYSEWFWGSLLWCAIITAAVAVLLFRRPSRRSARVLAALVALNAAALFALPELAGVRNAKIDLGFVTFLREHLGLERMYTLGPLAPNYGAYFHVASINHNSVPIPANWIRYIQQSIDPDISGVLFVGYLPQPISGRERAIREHVPGLEAAAVKYIVAFPGERLFPLHSKSPITAPRLVYRSELADIYEVPHPAPYFDVQGGPCILSANSRESTRVSCKAPAVLIRRELFYPGWQAYVNGKPEQIRADSIFESIQLPAGDSKVSFAYSPSHIGWAYAAMIAGLLTICMQLIMGRAAQRPASETANTLVAAG
jgi:hypothetical protein